MSLQLDPHTGKITYNGREVGEHVVENGKSTVHLDIEYKTDGEWIAPLSWFAYGLSLLPENRPAPAQLEIETPDDSIGQELDVLRYLTEKHVKRGGYVWKFHKTDMDTWPSLLHGHDYDKGLKLDALTGEIYDVGTRQHCKTLKATSLKDVQDELRLSDDFKDAVEKLIDLKSTNEHL